MNAAPGKAATAKTGKSKKPTQAKKPAQAKKPKKKLPKISIVAGFCKGCGICVAFCPTQVLAMEGGKTSVVNLEACIACMFCELRCPDFAISVEPAKE